MIDNGQGSTRSLDPTKTYKIHIPPNVPMRDFWSIILYGCESRTFLNSPKFTVSSKTGWMMAKSKRMVAKW